MGIRHEPDEEQLAGNLRAIRLAAQHADVVIAAAHSHQGDGRPHSLPSSSGRGRRRDRPRGRHRGDQRTPSRRAVELQGRPVLYGLGNFFWCDMQEPIQRYFYDESRALLRERFDDPAAPTDADLMGVLNDDSFSSDATFRG